MGFLVHSRGEHTTLSSWEDLFDVIVVGAAKPGFLSNDYMSLFQVEKSGTLRNIEDKDSLCLQTITGGNKIFQGGWIVDNNKTTSYLFFSYENPTSPDPNLTLPKT